MGTLSEEVRTEVLCGRICDLEAENDRLRELASLMAVHWLPNDVRMTLDEWHDRDERICDELRKLGIEISDE